MAKKKSKQVSVEELINEAKFYEWCIVDTDNKFAFNDNNYLIDSIVKQYVVLNKPKKVKGQWNEWSNEALMSRILCVDNGDEIRFFDQNLTEVSSDHVKTKLR